MVSEENVVHNCACVHGRTRGGRTEQCIDMLLIVFSASLASL